MGFRFRFRRRLRIFPGIVANFGKNGLSSVTFGRPGASVNVPINRPGRSRGTVGIPSTGLSWTEELGAPPEPQTKGLGFDPSNPTHASVLAEAIRLAKDTFIGPNCVGELLWSDHGMGLVAYLLDREDTPPEIRNHCEVVRSWDRIEVLLRRAPDAQGVTDVLKGVVGSAQALVAYGKERGIVQD